MPDTAFGIIVHKGVVGPHGVQVPAAHGIAGLRNGDGVIGTIGLRRVPGEIENKPAFVVLVVKNDGITVVVLVARGSGYGGIGQGFPGKWHPVYGAAPEIGGGVGRYALAATRYFSTYGLGSEEGKRLLAKISVKSHYNGYRNPKAWMRRTITVDEVVSAPIIAWPLGLLDCCGVNDGASAAVMCRTDEAKNFRPNGDYITIKGVTNSCGPGWGNERHDYSFTTWEETDAAARQAYQMAGISNPRKELSMAEVHDCFSIAELIAVESLGICEKGHAKEDIESGAWEQEGEIPINISGGLKSFGHPAGASGGREVYEFYKQFQGKAEDPSRQLKNVKLGLAHNQGGHPGNFVCGITIVGEPSYPKGRRV